jgi:hypothetical protein
VDASFVGTWEGVLQTGAELDMKAAVIGGEYRGEINKDGTELTGHWTQGPGNFPLTLKKTK